jgi:hypothetical protein
MENTQISTGPLSQIPTIGNHFPSGAIDSCSDVFILEVRRTVRVIWSRCADFTGASRVIVWYTYIRCNMCRKFKMKFAAVPVSKSATIYNRTKSFEAADSILASMRTHSRNMLTGGNLENLLLDCRHLREVNWLGLRRKRLCLLYQHELLK